MFYVLYENTLLRLSRYRRVANGILTRIAFRVLEKNELRCYRLEIS